MTTIDISEDETNRLLDEHGKRYVPKDLFTHLLARLIASESLLVLTHKELVRTAKRSGFYPPPDLPDHIGKNPLKDQMDPTSLIGVVE